MTQDRSFLNEQPEQNALTISRFFRTGSENRVSFTLFWHCDFSLKIFPELSKFLCLKHSVSSLLSYILDGWAFHFTGNSISVVLCTFSCKIVWKPLEWLVVYNRDNIIIIISGKSLQSSLKAFHPDQQPSDAQNWQCDLQKANFSMTDSCSILLL